MPRLLILLILSFLGSACIQSTEDHIDLHPAISDDSRYLEAYDQATVEVEVIQDFETRFIVHATILSKEFRKALGERYQELFNEVQPVLSESTENTGVFVSVFHRNEENSDLRDPNLWTIQFEKGGELLRPLKVERLREKERFQPFFRGINVWSKEYLLLFKTPPPSVVDKKLQTIETAKLILSSQDARVYFRW